MKNALFMVMCVVLCAGAAQAALDDIVLEEVVKDGIHYVVGADEIPARVLNFKKTPPQLSADRPFVPATEFVPLGQYAGDFGDATWAFQFDDLRRHNCNTYYLNGNQDVPYPPGKINPHNTEGTIAFVRTADQWGIRTYYQNSGSPMRWPQRIRFSGDRQQIYNNNEKWLKEVLPIFADDPALKRGLLVWGPTEELDIETAREPLIGKLKRDVFDRLDPFHPMTILLMADTKVQEALYENVGDLPIIGTDPYYTHRTVRWAGMTAWYSHVLRKWSDLAYDRGSRLWLVTPCFSEGIRFRYEDGGYKNYRMINPQTARAGPWLGLAHGATGFYLFSGYRYHGSARACLTRLDWQPTEEYVGVSRFFRTVAHLSPIVTQWKRSDVQVQDSIVIGQFSHPDFKGTFRVVVNRDVDNDVEYMLAENSFGLEGYNRAPGKMTLPAGGGVVLFAGSKSEVDQLQALLGPGHPGRAATSRTGAEIWNVSSDGQDFSEKVRRSGNSPVAIGGKGGIPLLYITVMPGRGDKPGGPYLGAQVGKILDWGEGVKVPVNAYHPPYPEKDEKTLVLNWDLSAHKVVWLERAYFDIELTEPLHGGRAAVFPIVEKGLGFARQTEFMPRWEMEMEDTSPTTLRIEITGIVRDWLEGALARKGVLLTYKNWPDVSGQMKVKAVSRLHLVFQPDGGSTRYMLSEGMTQISMSIFARG